MPEVIVNLSAPQEKRMLLEKIRGLEGPHRIEIVKHRKRRSDRQNRYYWPCFVQPFADFLRGQGETITDDEAHLLMRAKFLRQTVVNRETGEAIGQRIRSTTELTTEEFNNYLELCAQWLAENFDIVVPEPDVYREQ